MSDIIFGLLPEVWEVSLFPYLFVSLTFLGLIGLVLRLVRG